MDKEELIFKLVSAQFSGTLKCHSYPEGVNKALIGFIKKEENLDEPPEVELKLVSEKTFNDMCNEYDMTLYDVDGSLKPIIRLKNKELTTNEMIEKIKKRKILRMKTELLNLQEAFKKTLNDWEGLDSDTSHKYDENYPFQTDFDNLYYEVCDWVEFHTDE
jgi:hypothetical protein